MRKTSTLFFITSLILVLVISACSPAAATPTSGENLLPASTELPTLASSTATKKVEQIVTISLTATENPPTSTPSPSPEPASLTGTLTLRGEYGYGTGKPFSRREIQLSADEQTLIVTTSAGIFTFSTADLSPKLAIHEPIEANLYERNIRISHDGTQAVSTSNSSTGELVLRVWDLVTGELLKEYTISMEDMTGFYSVMEIAISPDHQQAALLDGKGMILAINLADGKLVKKIEDYINNTSTPLWLEFDSTGKNAYYVFRDVSSQGIQSVGLNTTSWLESSIESTLVVPYFPWKYGVFSPKRSNSGYNFGYFTNYGSKTVAAMDYTTLAQRFKIPRNDYITSFAFSQDGSKVVMAGSEPIDLEVWTVDTLKAPEESFRTSRELWGVAVTSDGKSSFGIDDHGTLFKWQSGQSEPVMKTDGFWPLGTGIEFTEDGESLRLFTDNTYAINNNVFEFDPNNGALKGIIPNPYVLKDMKDIYPQSIALSPDKSLMAAVYSPTGDKAIRLFDNTNGKVIRKIPTKVGFDDLDFTPDGQSLIGFGLPDNPIQVLDIKNGKVLRKFPVKDEFADGVAEMRLSGDKSTMVLSSWGGNLKAYNTDTFELKQALDPSVSAAAFAINNDGSRAAILTQEGKLLLWDIPSNSLLPEYLLDVRTDTFASMLGTHLAFSLDGTQLALSTSEGLIRVFDIAP
jgi:WD40 repeat protein